MSAFENVELPQIINEVDEDLRRDRSLELLERSSLMHVFQTFSTKTSSFFLVLGRRSWVTGSCTPPTIGIIGW
jgi:ABC-type lipoprotein export system ATPase subunit